MVSQKTKEELVAKQGHRCAICGKEGVPLYIDHIIAKSAGGTDDVSNIRLVCAHCNATYSRTITTSLSGSLGAALIGGAVAGPVGAVVGAVTGAAFGYTASGVHPDVR